MWWCHAWLSPVPSHQGRRSTRPIAIKLKNGGLGVGWTARFTEDSIERFLARSKVCIFASAVYVKIAPFPGMSHPGCLHSKFSTSLPPYTIGSSKHYHRVTVRVSLVLTLPQTITITHRHVGVFVKVINVLWSNTIVTQSGIIGHVGHSPMSGGLLLVLEPKTCVNWLRVDTGVGTQDMRELTAESESYVCVLYKLHRDAPAAYTPKLCCPQTNDDTCVLAQWKWPWFGVRGPTMHSSSLICRYTCYYHYSGRPWRDVSTRMVAPSAAAQVKTSGENQSTSCYGRRLFCYMISRQECLRLRVLVQLCSSKRIF